MTLEDRARLLARAQRALGTSAKVAVALPHRKAIVGIAGAPGAAVDAEVDPGLAQAAVDKLRAAEIPEAAELAALEACIRFMRPAWLIRRDRITARASEAPAPAVRAAVEALLCGVGAVVPRGQSTGIGTGFLVGRRALVTNRHVLRQLAKDEALTPGAARVMFGLEANEIETRDPIPITGVIAVHPGADVAVLALASDGPHPGLPVLVGPRPAVGSAVVVVGYPASDGRAPMFARAVYGDQYDVKRAAPGEVIGGDAERLFHDASTLGGNSGSPVIDLAASVVVGVHSTGYYANRNEAVLASVMVAEEKVRQQVSALTG